MGDFEKIAVEKFDNVGLLNTTQLSVYFSHTEDYTLISIPEWNWCYLWEVSKNDEVAKQECIKALSVPMFEEPAEELTERFYQYLLGK
jgi:hypothetical protein